MIFFLSPGEGNLESSFFYSRNIYHKKMKSSIHQIKDRFKRKASTIYSMQRKRYLFHPIDYQRISETKRNMDQVIRILHKPNAITQQDVRRATQLRVMISLFFLDHDKIKGQTDLELKEKRKSINTFLSRKNLSINFSSDSSTDNVSNLETTIQYLLHEKTMFDTLFGTK